MSSASVTVVETGSPNWKWKTSMTYSPAVCAARRKNVQEFVMAGSLPGSSSAGHST